LLGSVASNVSQQARSPVLLVK